MTSDILLPALTLMGKGYCIRCGARMITGAWWACPKCGLRAHILTQGQGIDGPYVRIELREGWKEHVDSN
jgi:DNA-directed RNA polymerase subunit RPC12/RpoP